MNWKEVANYLNNEAEAIRERAINAFPNDLVAQKEMLTRASIFRTFAQAIKLGIENDRP